MVNKLTVLDGGLFTTIQDKGRIGFRKYGVPASGVIDIRSYTLANKLVGNSNENPVLECTLKGGKFRFENRSLFSITGATMRVSLNGKEISINRSIIAESGDELELGFAKRGCRSYLAIRGNLILDQLMGSYSTYTIGRFGGFNGRTLKEGDIITWNSLDNEFKTQEAKKEEIPYFSSKLSVRIMIGPEWDWLDQAVKDAFLHAQFEVSSQSNRMGVKLSGETVNAPVQQMISSPVIPGIVQLPPNGQPIILMADGQTIGGYPRIAKVLDEDLWRLGQVKAKDKVKFELVRYVS